MASVRSKGGVGPGVFIVWGSPAWRSAEEVTGLNAETQSTERRKGGKFASQMAWLVDEAGRLDSELAAESARKMAEIVEAGLEAGVGDAEAAAQHFSRALETNLKKISMRRLTDQSTKNSSEVEGTHVNASGKGRERMGMIAFVIEKVPHGFDPLRVPGKLARGKEARFAGILKIESSMKDLAG